MNGYQIRQWVRRQTRRLGVDVVRYPTPRDLAGHLALLVEELGIDHVLDVGANEGQYGDFLRSIGYRGRITSFEPVSSTFGALQSAALGDEDWTTVPVALGAFDGSAEIHVTGSSDMASMLAPQRPDAASGTSIERLERVDVRRLDGLFDQHVGGTETVLLKLDTQGWDLEVLRGATGCIDRIQAVQTEVSMIPIYEGMPTWLDSINHLGASGFDPTGLFPVTYFGGFRSMEMDLVMARSVVRAADGGAHTAGGSDVADTPPIGPP